MAVLQLRMVLGAGYNLGVSMCVLKVCDWLESQAEFEERSCYRAVVPGSLIRPDLQGLWARSEPK